MTNPPQPPANWYPDPDGSGGWRYWDGREWTQRAPAAPGPPVVPMPPGLPQRKKHGCLYAVLAVVALVIIAGVIGAVAGSSTKSTTTAASTPAASQPTTNAPTTTPKTSPPTTTPPTKPPIPVVLWSQSGSGIQSGPQFTVPSGDKGWDEIWTYNCANFGSSGNFVSSITGYGNAAGTTDTGTNQLGASGSGTNHYYDTGTFAIQINSECAWTEKVMTVP